MRMARNRKLCPVARDRVGVIVNLAGSRFTPQQRKNFKRKNPAGRSRPAWPDILDIAQRVTPWHVGWDVQLRHGIVRLRAEDLINFTAFRRAVRHALGVELARSPKSNWERVLDRAFEKAPLCGRARYEHA